MNRIFGAVVSALLALQPAPLVAQSSFTSVRVSLEDDRLQSYSGARLFSEDGNQYWFRAFGCEFEVEYPIQGSEYIDGVAVAFVEAASDPVDGIVSPHPGRRLELGARLIRGRVREIGRYRPQNFSCDTSRSLSLIFIVADENAATEKVVTVIAQFPIYPTERGNDVIPGTSPTMVIFGMKEDFFTPGQARRAWGAAGAITLALLRALGGR